MSQPSSNLTSCIECGHTISTSASRCIHCGTECYRGVICHFCRQKMRLSEAIERRIIDSNYYHDSCLKSIVQFLGIYLNCSDCGNLIGEFDENHYRRPCNQCGSTRPPLYQGRPVTKKGLCEHCDLPVIDPFHEAKTFKIETETGTRHGVVHRFCLSSYKARKSSEGCLGSIFLILVSLTSGVYIIIRMFC